MRVCKRRAGVRIIHNSRGVKSKSSAVDAEQKLNRGRGHETPGDPIPSSSSLVCVEVIIRLCRCEMCIRDSLLAVCGFVVSQKEPLTHRKIMLMVN